MNHFHLFHFISFHINFDLGACSDVYAFFLPPQTVLLRLHIEYAKYLNPGTDSTMSTIFHIIISHIIYQLLTPLDDVLSVYVPGHFGHLYLSSFSTTLLTITGAIATATFLDWDIHSVCVLR